MTVCYVFQDDYPWDVRVEKIVTSLGSQGIHVSVLARNLRGDATLEPVHEGVCVHRLPAPRNRRLRVLCNFPAFFSPIWLLKMYRVVRAVKPQLLIVRDLPLALAAQLVGRITGVPVVMDMAEDYPAMIQDTWRFRGPSLVDRIVRNPRALRLLERLVIARLDGLFVVSERSASRVKTLGARPDTVWVVGNTPRPNAASPPCDDPTACHDPDGLCMVYVGGLEETRGLDVAIRAMAIVVQTLATARFVIVGRGPNEAKLRALASELGIADHIVLAGPVAPEDVPKVIRSSDLGIVPHYVTAHTNTTLPNKIFDYMLLGRPVIVSHALALRDIVESSQCGLVYHDSDPAALAEAILRLRNTALRRAMGLAGRQAVLAKYNWRRDEQVLLTAMRHFGAIARCRQPVVQPGYPAAS